MVSLLLLLTITIDQRYLFFAFIDVHSSMMLDQPQPSPRDFE